MGSVDKLGSEGRIVVPALCAGALYKTTVHLEVRKMLHNVRQSFYWPGYREDIRWWCRQCRECNLIRPTVESTNLAVEHSAPPIQFKGVLPRKCESPVKSDDVREKEI